MEKISDTREGKEGDMNLTEKGIVFEEKKTEERM